MTTAWSHLGRVAPTELVKARLALHYAAQPLAAAAYAALPMKNDHSHTNLLWSPERMGFVGRALPSGHRAFLDLKGLRIGLLDGSDTEQADIELAGKTLAEAFAALASALRETDNPVGEAGLKLPEYDLPPSPLARSEPFRPDAEAQAELAHWFHDANAALTRVSQSHLERNEVRGWPHHFDIAALLTLDADKDPESARSLGAGFSPGDGSYAEPYFYVSPWPYPNPSALPQLPAGAHWHTEGFTAAILPGTAIAEIADDQEQRVGDALHETVEAALDLLRG